MAGAPANALRGRSGGEALREPSILGLARDARGAVFVEFLIAFLPVFTFFLCLVQLSLLYTVKVVTEHAAVNAARAAAVIIGDDPKSYGSGDKDINVLVQNGDRHDRIRDAALITLAPLVLNGTVDSLTVSYPPPDSPGAQGRNGTLNFAPMDFSNISKVRVRVEVDAQCRIAIANRIACSSLGNLVREALRLHPVKRVRAEAVFPYQGARYVYPD